MGSSAGRLCQSRTAVNAPSIEAHAGQSIQAAVDAASPGTVIFIDPATHKQTITITKPDIFLVGLSQPGGGAVVIDNPDGADNGIDVTAQGAGFTLLNVTVQNFGENGVLLTGVPLFLLDRVTAVSDGEYGIFPVLSRNGLIARSSASSNSDTGIYVGQSANIAVIGNRAFGNVNGIEIENTLNALVATNTSYDNTAGILVDLLPGLTVPVASNIRVENNIVRTNFMTLTARPAKTTSPMARKPSISCHTIGQQPLLRASLPPGVP